MQKITFTNAYNGLSFTFSSNNPLDFLENFDGNSLGADDITYKPIDFDGQRFIDTSLKPRSITASVQFTAKDANGRYSRAKAHDKWDEILKVFVPGNKGLLVWTDGVKSRQIECRIAEIPHHNQILPYLFSTTLRLIADNPYWYDTEEQIFSYDKSSAEVFINNDCGLAVPFTMIVQPSAELFLTLNRANGKGLAFSNTLGETFIIDTLNCTVTTESGELVNHLLSTSSEFFYLEPGENNLAWLGSPSAVELRYRKAYLGVG